jgi:hypothetical protein
MLSAIERAGVTVVDLVLARAELVEAGPRDAHRLERDDRLAPLLTMFAGRCRRSWRCRAGWGVGRLEDEELHLGCDVEREPLVARSAEVPLQHIARVAFEGFLRQVFDVAEHARDGGVLAAPRDDLERVGIGDREHVGFLDARVALDRRPVEGHAFLERGFELRRRDGEALERAEHVGEPEPHEANAALLHGAQDVVELLLHLGFPRVRS